MVLVRRQARMRPVRGSTADDTQPSIRFSTVRDPLSKNSLKLAALLLAAGLLFAMAAVGAYFVVFGPKSGYSLSQNDAAWSNFGSYVGGVIGPAFSFLAFVGVLITVWLQAKQLDTSRVQANLEEIQRALANISVRIDTLLAQTPTHQINHHRLRGAPVSIFTVISGAGTAALSSSSDYIVQASNEELIAIAREAVAAETAAIGLELEQLAWCLQEYQANDGSLTVVEFYKRRYGAIICWLDAIGKLNSHHRVQNYFKPKELRQFLAP